MESFVLLGALGIESLEDLRNKRLTVWILCLTGIVGVILHAVFQRGEYLSLLGGIAVGVIMIVVSLLSRGRVGLGDGLMLTVTGIYLGFEKNLVLFVLSQLLTACYALFLLVFRKKKGSYEIPFVPFMLIAYVGLLAL